MRLAKNITVASSLLLLTSCAGAPVIEMDAAKEAINKARDAEAEIYAPEDFNEAMKAYEQAQSNMQAKNYGEARKLALRAKARADAANKLAARNKDEAKRNTETLLYAIELAVKGTKNNLKNFRARIPKKIADRVGEEITELESAISQIKSLRDQGKFASAVELATKIKESAISAQNSVLEYAGEGAKAQQ